MNKDPLITKSICYKLSHIIHIFSLKNAHILSHIRFRTLRDVIGTKLALFKLNANFHTLTFISDLCPEFHGACNLSRIDLFQHLVIFKSYGLCFLKNIANREYIAYCMLPGANSECCQRPFVSQ